MHRTPNPLLSLIVPVWRDDQLAADLIERCVIDPDRVEWIVAAVAPQAPLTRLAAHGALRLIACEAPSRGAQMNAGAAVARGEILCFHHADSGLRPEHVAALMAAAADGALAGGAFHRKFDDRHPSMIGWERILRRLSQLGGPLFGDQSIFVRSRVFERLGGYADLPLMEDIEFSRRLRRAGRTTLLDPPIWSSPRRFQELGSWRTTALNISFIALFYAGVSPRTLHRWYYGIPAADPDVTAPAAASQLLGE